MDSGVFPIRISSPKDEGILQVSKWIKTQVLLSAEEMQDLIQALSKPLFFVVVSEPIPAEEAILSPALFVERYSEYIALLEQGKVPLSSLFRRFFSCAMATDLQGFYALSTGNDKLLIKPKKPVVQLQAHHFFYSDLDGKFHSMVLSSESVTWGLQFAYPQLYQDPQSHRIVKTSDLSEFPSTALFSKLMKWMREFTLPTPFVVRGVRMNSPIRVGKQSLAWIKNHPQLKQKGIEIAQVGL